MTESVELETSIRRALPPPPEAPSALAAFSPQQHQRDQAFCDAAFARLLDAGEVVTALGVFRVTARAGAAGWPIPRGAYRFWETQRLRVAVDADFARACRSAYQPRFMSRFPGAP